MSDEDPPRGPDTPPEGADEPDEAKVTDSSEPLTDPAELVTLAPRPAEADVLARRAQEAEARLEEVLATYRGLKTEGEAHRERITRNVERRFSERRERLLLKFIEILDNLDRALDAAEHSYATQPLIEGLILVRSHLLQTLQEEGLERIPVLGLAYDPATSEAVETRRVADLDYHQVVVQELQRGYRINGRLARASRVVVGQYAEGS